ncbi:hypothetical protein RJ640_023409 [Escallonia rubra]|uniref:Uncharacterized protein n=1 Tax=Escallonia rubra TaxID=112253 RepID=A0AA88UI81_9ASTE|nr:hypothetical protein RJ640_023409 [Escallonia rubra]
MFVLQTLFDLSLVQPYPLFDLIISFFGNMLNFKLKIRKVVMPETAAHILGLLHDCYLPCDTAAQNTNQIIKHSAVDLDRAGVDFKEGKGRDQICVNFSTSCRFSCLRRCCYSWFFQLFGRTSFEIPKLCIYDSTEPFLRNLIAFEQCSPSIFRHITSYAFLMDTLINTKDDVEVLEKAGELENHLGASEDATRLFNTICKEVVLGEFTFWKQWHDVEEYCNSEWPSHLASLRRDYFSSPSALISVFAALILFALTVLHTVYTGCNWEVKAASHQHNVDILLFKPAYQLHCLFIYSEMSLPDLTSCGRGATGKSRQPVTSTMWTFCCLSPRTSSTAFSYILRVPQRLRQLKESAYTPRIVSIGPYHHKHDERLKEMEYHKRSYTHSLLSRVLKSNQLADATIKDITDKILEKAALALSCYAATHELNDDVRTSFEIPKLCLYDSTEPFLRNLIAFEQCSPSIPLHITSYAFLMDTLINTKKDVKVLEEAGVLENYLGASEDATRLFNTICKEVVLGEFTFGKQWLEVEKYRKSEWPSHVASLRRDYFSSPWALISVIAALILFALAVVQTVYTIRG